MNTRVQKEYDNRWSLSCNGGLDNVIDEINASHRSLGIIVILLACNLHEDVERCCLLMEK